MMGLWSMLPQFTYVKLIIAVDPDIDVRRWEDVIWALSTRFDASRDMLVMDDTPIDYLDFASPKAGLGGKLGLDATTKIGPETDRDLGPGAGHDTGGQGPRRRVVAGSGARRGAVGRVMPRRSIPG